MEWEWDNRWGMLGACFLDIKILITLNDMLFSLLHIQILRCSDRLYPVAASKALVQLPAHVKLCISSFMHSVSSARRQ